MTRHQRLLVGMNLTEADRARSRYAEMFTRMCGAREVHFLHVREEQDLPPGIHDAYPQIREGEKESARQHLEDKACGVFSAPDGVLVSCEVVEGALLEEIIGHVRDLDIDLVLVGRRSGEQEPGVLAEKLARKAPCSVLFLPENAPEDITRILVAVDFSNHARAALEVAVELAVARGHQEILCLHVYKVPLGYSHTGKSLEEFEEILRQNAEEQYREMIAKIDDSLLRSVSGGCGTVNRIPCVSGGYPQEEFWWTEAPRIELIDPWDSRVAVIFPGRPWREGDSEIRDIDGTVRTIDEQNYLPCVNRRIRVISIGPDR